MLGVRKMSEHSSYRIITKANDMFLVKLNFEVNLVTVVAKQVRTEA